MMGGYVFQLPVVLWGNAKRRRREAPPFDLAPPLATMTRSSGTVVFRFNPQKREPPRRNGLGCHKTERPGLTAPCMIVVCRICHASPARGVFQTADGFGCIAPRYRFAHNGRRIPQGLPLKSVGGREQVSLSSALSSRPVCQHRVKGCVDRSASLSITS